MDIFDLIKTRRSVRRFSQEKLDRNFLIELVEAARCAPATANIQALEYIIVDEPQVCQKLFETLSWAGHVRPKRNPLPNQRPAAYIVVLVDTAIKENATADAAAAVENILLAAWGKGVGSCLLGAIDRIKILQILGIDEKYLVDLVVALGKPAEKAVGIKSMGREGQFAVFHVPSGCYEFKSMYSSTH